MTRHSWLSARADAVESPACCSARSAKVCCGTRNAQWLWSADRSAPADRCERYDGNRAGRLMQHSLADGSEKLTVEATTTTCADDDQPCFGGLPEQLLGRPAVVDDPQYCVVPVRCQGACSTAEIAALMSSAQSVIRAHSRESAARLPRAMRLARKPLAVSGSSRPANVVAGVAPIFRASR